jgi:spermidine synthase
MSSSALPGTPVLPTAAPAAGVNLLAPLLFAVTLFLSALLLFLVQPMIGRMILPLLGGSPNVWNTCMVFFQAALLAGYLYAHTSTRWLTPRRQLALHAPLLLLPFLVLPLAIGASWQPDAEQNPVFWLLALLVVCVGLPFFVVATSAPLLQQWFAGSGHPSARDPYFLYGASNLGSLIALLSYPLLLEPFLYLRTQSLVWTVGYGLLVLLVLGCGLYLARQPAAPPAPPPPPAGKKKQTMPAAEKPRPADPARPTLGVRLRWILLAFVPSSLMLGLTTYLSTDIAAIPLLWVIPLALYLLSFVLAFSRLPPEVHQVQVRLLPFVVLGQVFLMTSQLTLPLLVLIVLHTGVFFLAALVCHGELARTRPATTYLTEFYLWLAVGGVLGGLCNALAAPLLFRTLLEYPLVLAAACLLLPPLDLGRQYRWLRWVEWGAALGLVGLALGFLIRGGWAFSRHLASSPRGGGLNVVIDEFLHGLLVWVDVHLLNLEGLGESPRRLAGAVLVLIVIAGAVHVLWRREGRLDRAFDVILSLALGVIAAGFILIPATAAGARKIGYEKSLDKLVIYGVPCLLCLTLVHRPVRLGLGVATLFLAVSFCQQMPGDVIYRERSFFGVLSVERDGNTHRLMHGTTKHGAQERNLLLGVGVQRPLTYYHEDGPVGELFRVFGSPRLRVGVVGLGTGTLACYAKQDQEMVFYEIDPAIVGIASNGRFFTFLETARRMQGARIEIVLGDARLKLAQTRDGTHEMLLVDAFSSDAIPTHLLTRQALALYRQKLTEHGLLAFHISNRHVDLEPVLAALAEDAGMAALINSDGDATDIGKDGSTWVVLTKHVEDLEPLHESFPGHWQPLKGKPSVGVWTDDFSNLLRVFQWR